MKCVICDQRKAKRFCPALRNEICSICCGNERERTLDCPLDCEYLNQAHLHEKPRDLTREEIPEPEIEIPESFVQEKLPLLVHIAKIIVDTALRHPGVTDRDVQDALQALATTYKTLISGLVYESLPTNPIAADIYRLLQQGFEQVRQEEDRQGIHRTTNRDILGVAVLLLRMAKARDNSRPKGKAFLGFLRRWLLQLQVPIGPGGQRPGQIIVPGQA